MNQESRISEIAKGLITIGIIAWVEYALIAHLLKM